jgi:putative transposase
MLTLMEGGSVKSLSSWLTSRRVVGSPGAGRPRPATWRRRIPKLRAGTFFPSLLEPRRRIDRALWAVVMEAYVHGVSTRKVDDLVRALGMLTSRRVVGFPRSR